MLKETNLEFFSLIPPRVPGASIGSEPHTYIHVSVNVQCSAVHPRSQLLERPDQRSAPLVKKPNTPSVSEDLSMM